MMRRPKKGSPEAKAWRAQRVAYNKALQVEPRCKVCNWLAKNRTGLAIHTKRKHASPLELKDE